MLRRGLTAPTVTRRAATTTTNMAMSSQLVQAQRTDLTFFTYYWWPSWAMGIWYPLATVWPVVIADIMRPSATASKLPILHQFHEKRIDAKLRACMDSAVTQWSEELDAASIDSAIARTF